MQQQQRADSIEKELVLCSEKGKCDEEKKKSLKQQLSEVKGQVDELEKEALYDGKETHIMSRTVSLRTSRADIMIRPPHTVVSLKRATQTPW